MISNLVCLDLSRESLERVYVWDHEHMDRDGAAFYLVAPSFGAFIDLLHKSETASSDSGPTLVRRELSGTLKTRINELLKQRRN